MAGKKPYTADSVQRALTHHEANGTIRSYSPPSPDRPTHRIVSRDGQEIEVRSLPELYAVTWGVRCGEVGKEAKLR